jgi:membrane protease YdiL (CAAX protease family)
MDEAQNPPAEIDYWTATRQPLSSLVFLAPLLALYECGVIWIGGERAETLRNGADAWMRDWLHQIGITGMWYLPVLLAGVLLAWHHVAKPNWRFSWETFGGMFAESLLFAFVLILIGQALNGLWRSGSEMTLSTIWPNGLAVRFVTFVGAGIYEEFLFRLCLVPLGYAALRALWAPPRWAAAGTILATSLLFSLAHYLGPNSDGQALAMFSEAAQRIQSTHELWAGFAFRTLAGAYFTLLFCFRGFGITVGCHAAYDLFVGIVLVSEL